jgi:hypothetical protein
MNREACKFFSGAFAALGYAHAAYAVATSQGVINEPVFLGRRWGVGFMWTEAVIYTALALALGRIGWGADVKQQLQSTQDAQTDPAPLQARPASVD